MGGRVRGFSARRGLVGGSYAVGVGTVEMDEVLVGLGNVDKHSSQKLEWVERRLVIGVMARVGFIDLNVATIKAGRCALRK